MSLTFAETHNMVAYLSKSDASEGFNQIIDFLNGSSIKYAFMVNPNIYVSHIKQFWTTVAVKQVNDVTRLQALVDKKKVVVTEATIREALYLDDAECVDCLPNEEMFTELAKMGYEKPSTKFTFYKAFFSSHLVRNVDSTTKFYMYPCFLQLIIRKQVGDLSTHTTKCTSLALTQKKVFANMRRVGKVFFGVETPLFEGMLVEQEVDEEGDADEHVEEVNTGDAAYGVVSAAHGEVRTVTEEQSIQSPTPPTPPPQPPQDIPSTSQVQQTPPQSPQEGEETGEEEQVVSVEAKKVERMIAEMDQDDDVVLEDDKEEDKEVANAVKDVEETKVDESAQDQGRQAESQAKIYKIDMDHANKVLSMQEDETELAEVQEVVDVVTTAKLITEVVTAVSETITAASKGILVEEPKPLKKKQQIELDEQYVKELHAELNKDIGLDEAIDHVKRKAKEDPVLNETPAERVANRRKLDEEVEELRRHLHIVPNEDDDVFTEATPLARKVSVVDYQLILLVKRKYPLTRFTLDQVLNAVRLEVEEESEVSLELLRFTRQQHQEGQH
nr:hypothetical protein [Tanacetum cinerariifolium]